MRTYTYVFILIMSVGYMHAQNELGFQIGRSFSTFQFTDSSGERMDDYQFVSGDRLGINYGTRVGSSGFILLEGGYRQGGSRLYDRGDLFQWQLHYFDVSVGYEVLIPIQEHIQLRAGAGLYGAYLISGQQQIGNEYFDLRANKSLSGFDVGYQLRGGLYHRLGSGMYVGLQYAYLGGMLNLENGASNVNQRSATRAHTVGISIISSIQKSSANKE